MSVESANNIINEFTFPNLRREMGDDQKKGNSGKGERKANFNSHVSLFFCYAQAACLAVMLRDGNFFSRLATKISDKDGRQCCVILHWE